MYPNDSIQGASCRNQTLTCICPLTRGCLVHFCDTVTQMLSDCRIAQALSEAGRALLVTPA